MIHDLNLFMVFKKILNHGTVQYHAAQRTVDSRTIKKSIFYFWTDFVCPAGTVSD